MDPLGETVKGPLGWIVHARSGDKGSNANVGFWVRHRDEWEWLRWVLSVQTMKELLADEYNGKKIVSYSSSFPQMSQMEDIADEMAGSIRVTQHVRCALLAA